MSESKYLRHIFQSTLPRGSDILFSLNKFTNLTISIHAPSRERLVQVITLLIPMLNFNPRSLAGATPAYVKKMLFAVLFQSTLPRGSDSLGITLNPDTPISIHAPSRERHIIKPCAESVVRFQSTLPRGSDDWGADGQAAGSISIHAPSRERHYWSPCYRR